MVKIIDCPRDAMQGIKTFIPTEKKIEYLNQLLKVGFDTLDFGSFVSPKAIPQLRDTAEVVKALDVSATKTKLLSIIANERGARDASKFEKISYLGYPFSISETFQKRNTNAGLNESLKRLEKIKIISDSSEKQLVVYITMAFGNPYYDEWDFSIVYKWVKRLVDMGIDIIVMSDTVGLSNKAIISEVFKGIIPAFPDVEFGAHFHTKPHTWREKMESAFESGCRRYDGALKGYGGCPMSGYGLVGNMSTENIIRFMQDIGEDTGLDIIQLKIAMEMASDFFPK